MADENIRDYGESIGRGNSGIRRGHVFTEDEKSWEILREGCGIIVYMENGKIIAFGDAWNYRHPYWNDYLRKHLVTAKCKYGDAAFLVRRDNGFLIYQKEMPRESALERRKFSVVPFRKRKHYFSGKISENAIA